MLIIVILFFFIPTGEVVTMPGSAVYMDKMLNIQGYATSKSNFMLTTVYMFKGNYFFRLIEPFFNYMILRPEQAIYRDGETKREYTKRQEIAMKESKENALNAALSYLGFSTVPTEESAVPLEEARRAINYTTMSIFGPSAGLMFSLEIVRQLDPVKDITKGYKTAGTGTINAEGEVGRVGSVRLKLKTALKKDAEIFFVPNDPDNPNSNLLEANRVNEELGNRLQVVPVSSLVDALMFLEELPVKVIK